MWEWEVGGGYVYIFILTEFVREFIREGECFLYLYYTTKRLDVRGEQARA